MSEPGAKASDVQATSLRLRLLWLLPAGLAASLALGHLRTRDVEIDGDSAPMTPDEALLVRPTTRTAMDGFERWRPWLSDGEHRTDCTRRTPTGGYDCGVGIRVDPAFVEREGKLVAALVISRIRSNARVGIHVDWPEDTAASLILREPEPLPAVVAQRGAESSTTQCADACPLALPGGGEPLSFEIFGPAAPLALVVDRPTAAHPAPTPAAP